MLKGSSSIRIVEPSDLIWLLEGCSSLIENSYDSGFDGKYKEILDNVTANILKHLNDRTILVLEEDGIKKSWISFIYFKNTITTTYICSYKNLAGYRLFKKFEEYFKDYEIRITIHLGEKKLIRCLRKMGYGLDIASQLVILLGYRPTIVFYRKGD